MPVVITCSACQGKMQVSEQMAGKAVKCPRCAQVVRVRGPLPAAAPPRPAANGSPAPSADQLLDRSDLSEAEADRVRSALKRDERLVWVARPDPAASFRAGWMTGMGFFMTTFLMLALVGVMFAAELVKDAGFVVVIVPGALGLLCLVLGLCCPAWQRWRAGRTVYAITSRRALGWDCGFFGGRHFKVYSPAEAARAVRQGPRRGGAGNLIFRVRTATVRTRQASGPMFFYSGFFCIRDVLKVEKLLRETLAAAR